MIALTLPPRSTATRFHHLHLRLLLLVLLLLSPLVPWRFDDNKFIFNLSGSRLIYQRRPGLTVPHIYGKNKPRGSVARGDGGSLVFLRA